MSSFLLVSVDDLMKRKYDMRLRGYDKAFVPLRVFFIDAIVLDFLPQRIEIQHDAVA